MASIPIPIVPIVSQYQQLNAQGMMADPWYQYLQQNSTDVAGALTNITTLQSQVAALQAAPLAPFINVKSPSYGAIGNGIADDTNAINLAITAAQAAGGGTVYFPNGNYLISSKITHSARINFLGDGGQNSTISVGNANISCFEFVGGAIFGMGFNGSNSFLANKVTLRIDNANPSGFAGNFIQNCYIQGGQYAVLNNGTDITMLNCTARYGYGTAIIKSTAGGHWYFRNKLDQNWPAGGPGAGTTINPRADNTLYALNAVVSNQGWILNATVGGTSGVGNPTLQPYETNIIDGSVTWRVAAPVVYYCFQMDTAAGENYMWGNDYNAPAQDAITMTNTGLDSTGAAPQIAYFIACNCGGMRNHAIHLQAGRWCEIAHCELTPGNSSSNFEPVATESGFTDRLIISHNFMKGNSNSPTAIKIFGGVNTINIDGNILQGDSGFTRLVLIDNGGGANTNFNIIGNNGTGDIVVNAGAADFYIIANNNTGGHAVTDAGTGIHKSISGNI